MTLGLGGRVENATSTSLHNQRLKAKAIEDAKPRHLKHLGQTVERWNTIPSAAQYVLLRADAEAELEQTADPALRAMVTKNIAALKRLEGGNMTNDIKGAESILSDKIIKTGWALRDLETKADQYPAEYVDAKRAEHIRIIQRGDAEATASIQTFIHEARTESATLRAQAGADRDPVVKAAEYAERTQLLESGVKADVLVADAQRMLLADRPERAAFLLGVADARGGGSPMSLASLRPLVEDSLDAAVPKRREARDLEVNTAKEVADYSLLRLKALEAANIGINANGDAGDGSDAAISRASSHRKTMAYRLGRRSDFQTDSERTDGKGPGANPVEHADKARIVEPNGPRVTS